jgi:hypothetical protein
MTTSSRTHESRPTAPVVTHVDNDPRAWQGESSVRHVGGPPNAVHAPSSSHNTPPQGFSDLGTPNLPYAHSHNTGSAESYGAAGSPQRQSQYRSSPYSSKTGALGITNAG